MCLDVIDDVRRHHDPNFASRLHCEHLVDAITRSGNFFQPLEPLDVRLDAFPPSARTATADGVGRLHENSLNGAYLDLVVVRLDGMHDIGMLTVLASQIGTDDRV